MKIQPDKPTIKTEGNTGTSLHWDRGLKWDSGIKWDDNNRIEKIKVRISKDKPQ